MTVSVALMRKLEKLAPEVREAFLLFLEEQERWVTKEDLRPLQQDLRELTQAVATLGRHVQELTEAHKRAEGRITALEQAVQELTEAHQRAEARMTRLEENVARLEQSIARLEQAVQELTEAHKRAEARMTRMEERMDRMEATIQSLIEAQRETEAMLQRLIEALERTRQELERKIEMVHERTEALSDTVGYTLEDRALWDLPRVLRERFDIEVEGELWRGYVTVRDRVRQVNIMGYGRRNGERMLIIGEAKTRPSKREIERLVKLAQALSEQQQLPAFMLMVAYDFPPDIQEFLEEQGVHLIWSHYLRPPFA